VLALWSAGCAPAPEALASRTLLSGTTVAALAGANDTTVVLVYSPSDCFKCFGSLQSWLDWGRKHPRRLVLLFTREPRPAERLQLATYRIRPAGIISPRAIDRARPIATPAEALFVRGRLDYMDVLRRRELVTPLLRRIARTPAAAAPRLAGTRTKEQP
jgi:hypothetical protein